MRFKFSGLSWFCVRYVGTEAIERHVMCVDNRRTGCQGRVKPPIV